MTNIKRVSTQVSIENRVVKLAPHTLHNSQKSSRFTYSSLSSATLSPPQWRLARKHREQKRAERCCPAVVVGVQLARWSEIRRLGLQCVLVCARAPKSCTCTLKWTAGIYNFFCKRNVMHGDVLRHTRIHFTHATINEKWCNTHVYHFSVWYRIWGVKKKYEEICLSLFYIHVVVIEMIYYACVPIFISMLATMRSEEVILKKSALGYLLLFKQYVVVKETM